MKYRICIFFLFLLTLPALGFAQIGSAGGYIKVTIDTFCTHWHICAHDSVPIASATLIDDPNGDVYGLPGKAYKNVVFDSKNAPDGTGEIVFNGVDTVVCFDVIVSNPFDTAYAPIYIVDKNGFHIDPIIELRYKSTAKLSVLPALPPAIDTLVFPVTQVGQEVCSTLVYIPTRKSLLVDKVTFQKTGSFSITSTTPSLPATIKVGDTLKVQICFRAVDTGEFIDSFVTLTTCYEASLPVIGRGATALIYASDIDFGNVAVGTTACEPLRIDNKGSLPFILTRNWLLHDLSNFSIDSASAAKLPDTLQPGGHINLAFCYHPKFLASDSTTVDWSTNIEALYKDKIKSWSYLKGNAVKNDVKSDAQYSLSIYPNPASGNSIIIDVTGMDFSPFGWIEVPPTVIIYDVLGREVYRKEIPQGAGQLEILIGNLPSGSYCARMNGLKSVSLKFEILR